MTNIFMQKTEQNQVKYIKLTIYLSYMIIIWHNNVKQSVSSSPLSFLGLFGWTRGGVNISILLILDVDVRLWRYCAFVRVTNCGIRRNKNCRLIHCFSVIVSSCFKINNNEGISSANTLFLCFVATHQWGQRNKKPSTSLVLSV